jgi:hypothetical protein
MGVTAALPVGSLRVPVVLPSYGRARWSCVHMARKWLRRYEDGHVSARAFFSVLPSAYLLRKARQAIGALFHVLCAFSR